jgi:phosphoribosylglycinamide formyltransferase 1
MPRVVTLAVFVSGAGTTLEGLADRIRAGQLPAQIAVVVSDRRGTGAIELARHRGLDTVVRSPRTSGSGAAWTQEIASELDRRGVELVVLAGFLAILPKEFVALYRDRILNLHPSLLPKHGGRGMYGLRVHEAVLRSGDTETGVTVHRVTDSVDGGPILLQVRVPVRPDDTPEKLRARLHPIEVQALSETIARFARDQLPLPPRSRGAVD